MPVNFEVFKGLLIRFVTLRIRNGDCTERQLARLVGVSQPQLHNVLKGARPLKQSLADALLKHFQIGLLDLLNGCELCQRQHGEALQESLDRPERMRPIVLEPAANTRKSAGLEERLPGHKRWAS
jgi:transcriptional regulator with XRE-family HTH domain